jgi:hypothetical protein
VSFLLTLGFVANPNDTCVMYLGTGRSIALLAIYVNDLLLFTTTTELWDAIAAKHNAKFNCVDLGDITWCLDMRIATSADRHTICYDDDILVIIDGIQNKDCTFEHFVVID